MIIVAALSAVIRAIGSSKYQQQTSLDLDGFVLAQFRIPIKHPKEMPVMLFQVADTPRKETRIRMVDIIVHSKNKRKAKKRNARKCVKFWRHLFFGEKRNTC